MNEPSSVRLTNSVEEIGPTVPENLEILSPSHLNISTADEVSPTGCKDMEEEKTNGMCCGRSRFCRWEPSTVKASTTMDFCTDTSLHGLKYLGQPDRHFIERTFWFVSFLIGCGAAAWLISDIWITYYNNPIIVTFSPFETSIEQIPFPAVTICNMNKVLKSKAEFYIKKLEDAEKTGGWKDDFAREIPMYQLNQICSSSGAFSKIFNYSSLRGVNYDSNDPIVDNKTLIDFGITSFHSLLDDFLDDAAPECKDMLLLCVWQNEIRNCSELFQVNEANEFGQCCTFNMIPQEILRRHRPSENKINDTKEIAELLGWHLNETNGMLYDDNKTMVKFEDIFGWDLDISEQRKVKQNKSKEINDWAGWNLDEGFLMGKDYKSEFPRRQFRAGRSSGLSILLNPGLEEYFCTDSDSGGFLLQTHLPIDAPHVREFGHAIKPNSESFVSIHPEITLANKAIRSFRMEKRKCYFGGEFNLAFYKQYTTANCIDECVANRTYEKCNCTLFYMPRSDKRRICKRSQMQCAENIRKKSLKLGISKYCHHCNPTCTELEYVDEVTSVPLQNDPNLWLDNNNKTAKWAQSNVSIVHIYFEQYSAYPRYRTQLFGLSDLIANTGGLMGLCLGFSGLSFIEFFYFLTLRAWCRGGKKRGESLTATN